jgi:hypothetical protein
MVTVGLIQCAVAVGKVVKTTVLREGCLVEVAEAQMMERHVRLRVWRLEQQERGPLRWMEAMLAELVDGAAVGLLSVPFRS